MPLQALPDDVLVLVLEQLKEDTEALLSLTRCSRRVHTLTLPVLYSHVVLETTKDDRSQKLRSFTHTILSNPSLGSLVRSINLSETDWPWEEGISDYHIENEEPISKYADGPKNVDTDKLLDAVEDLPIPQQHSVRWKEALQADPRNLDAMAAVLLTRLPLLQRLETEWPDELVYTKYLFTDLALQQGSTVLARLTHLKLCCADDRAPYTNITAFDVLRVPSLTHVFGDGWGAHWTAERHEMPPDVPELSIQHVEMRNSYLKSHELEYLLKGCVSLQTFILHREGMKCSYLSPMPSSVIWSSLSHVRDSLQHLRLSQEMCEGPYDVLATEMLPLDFSVFSALTKLHVAADHVIKSPDSTSDSIDSITEKAMEMRLWERLPRSLELLRVLGPSTNAQSVLILDALRGVIGQAEKFPRLQEIQIEARFKHMGGEYDTTGILEEAKKSGIRLRLMDSTFRCPEDHDSDDSFCAVPDMIHWGMDGEYKWGTLVSAEQVRDGNDGSDSGGEEDDASCEKSPSVS